MPVTRVKMTRTVKNGEGEDVKQEISVVSTAIEVHLRHGWKVVEDEAGTPEVEGAVEPVGPAEPSAEQVEADAQAQAQAAVAGEPFVGGQPDGDEPSSGATPDDPRRRVR